MTNTLTQQGLFTFLSLGKIKYCGYSEQNKTAHHGMFLPVKQLHQHSSIAELLWLVWLHNQ